MIKKDDVFEVEDKLYCVLDTINYGGGEYALCNEMENERTFGAKYAVFQNFEDGIERVEDDDFLNKISPIFTNNITQDIYGEDQED